MTPMTNGIFSAPVARSLSRATGPRPLFLALPFALLGVAVHPGLAVAQQGEGERED